MSDEKFHTKENYQGNVDATVVETGSTGSVKPQHQKLSRQMKNRHIAMISIGGVIGTGLFLGTAGALRNGGPIGLLLGYMVVGSMCWAVMVSLGEMIAYLPIPGGHIKLAERFVSPSFSFTMGWNYWYNWTIILPAELAAAAVLINYWNPNTDLNAAWISMCLVVVVVINALGAGAYGEAEFWFASIKVITIVGLIILSFILMLGGGPSGDRIGFRHWKNPGPFVQYLGIPGATGRFAGFWACLSQAAFSFIGTEIVAIAAGETKNPRRNLPRAIKRVYIRILLFYFAGTFFIGIIVPSNAEGLDLASGDAASSPFVLAIQTAGIKTLPSIINACLLTSAWSAASSDLYTSSRALYGLALAGNAPKIFARTIGNGLPAISIAFCSLFSALAYMSVNAGAGKVFGWFANLTAVAGLMTWFGISFTYLRFYKGMKVQGIDRSKLPFASNLQPYAAYYGMCMSLLICFFSGFKVFIKGQWAVDTFITNYFPLALFPVVLIGARLYTKVPMVKPEDMDFLSGLEEIEAEDVPDKPPKNKIEAFWNWLM